MDILSAMAAMIFRLTLLLLALIKCSEASAGPLPITCIRDMEQDPTRVRALFERVDRMAVRELFDSHVRFYLADRGFVPIGEFVLRANFRDGREDESPLIVGAIRPLQFGSEPRHDASYVVNTPRFACRQIPRPLAT